MRDEPKLIALVVQGPKMTGSARQIPIGYGMFVFWIGGVTAIAGAVLAMRPFPKPELRPSRAPDSMRRHRHRSRSMYF